MSPNRKRKRAGISLIEMLIVIAIVVILVGLLLPVLQKIRHQAAVKETFNSLKEVALSLHKSQDIHKRFPPAWGPFRPFWPPGTPSTVQGGTVHYWLLPFLKADDVYVRGKRAAPGATPNDVWANPDVYNQAVPAYVSPADETTVDGTVSLGGQVPWGAGCYAANARVFGGLKVGATATAWDNKARMATIADGTSNTIAFATRYARCGSTPGGSAWAGGNAVAGFSNFMISGAFFASDIEDKPVTETYTTYPPFQVAPSLDECDPLLAHGYSSAGIQVALFDGSVRMISPTIRSKLWGEACHPCDGPHGGIGTSWE
jgi:type II secretory pathway pseudopilin PulG